MHFIDHISSIAIVVIHLFGFHQDMCSICSLALSFLRNLVIFIQARLKPVRSKPEQVANRSTEGRRWAKFGQPNIVVRMFPWRLPLST